MATAKKATRTPGRHSNRKSAAGRPDLKGAIPATGEAAANSEGRLVPVVGIGASAGGLEALKQLFRSLRSDTGMAFVVITHLGRGQKSALSDLLGRITPMPAQDAVNGMNLEPNHVYVRPADQLIAIRSGVLVCTPVDEPDHFPPVVIDKFFCSLAEHCKNQAIGIVLSGSGADGSRGLGAIKAEGGVTFAQDQSSAKVAEMPRAAAPAADYVLPPDRIASELAHIAWHPYIAGRGTAPPISLDGIGPSGLDSIFALIRSATGLDFAHYKPNTIYRRIARRMVLHGIDSPATYLKKLQSDPKEFDALHSDLLINVTSFFRDPEVFSFLCESVLPALVDRHKTDDPIRVWVPACATGEEAYSIAICLMETIVARGLNTTIQVFGTDVSAGAIKRARDALYPEAIAEDVSSKRLERFFVRVEGGYRVLRALRDSCVFALQDVTADPPFSKMDLVSCRNLLIYLKPEIQRRVLVTFHYSLNTSGTLLLGAAETVGPGVSQLFRQLGRTHRVYQRVNTDRRTDFYFRTRTEPRRQTQKLQPPAVVVRDVDDLEREADRIVMTHYAPPCVVIGPSLDIIQFRGSTGLYLEPAPGPASLNLLKMCKEGLSLELRTAIHQVRKTQYPVVREGLRVRSNSELRWVDVDVVPLRGAAGANHQLVVFRESPPRAAAIPESPRGKPAGKRGGASAAERELAALRRELVATQEGLRSIISELETKNEDLQSANEGILSANEELQSTNEELETAKEELQATNEELTSVNDEVRTRNAELKIANDDLLNSLGSINIGVVMLSSDLTIRRFNPAAQLTLGLIASDIGRPFSKIKTRLDPASPDQLVQRAIDSRCRETAEIRDVSGRWQLLSACPYITQDQQLDGAVLTVTDIHDSKEVQSELLASEQQWKDLFGAASDMVLSTQPLGRILAINRIPERLVKPPAVHKDIREFLAPADRKEWTRAMVKTASTGESSILAEILPLDDGRHLHQVTRIDGLKLGGRAVILSISTEMSKSDS